VSKLGCAWATAVIISTKKNYGHLQVFLFYPYDRNEKVEGHAMMVFCLAFFTSMAGIFGSLYNGRQQCIR